MYRTDPQVSRFQDQAIEWLPRILGALAILIIAYILARAAKWAIGKMVDRIPALRRHNEAEPGKTLGSLIGEIAFWLILLVGIMLALQPLGLTQVLVPVQELTTETFAFIPNLLGAGLIFFVGLVLAKIVRRIVEGTLLAANARRLAPQGRTFRHRRHRCQPRPPAPRRRPRPRPRSADRSRRSLSS